MKVYNQITCSRECLLLRSKQIKKEKLQDPEYRKVFYEKKKASALKDYERHKERCILNAKKLRYVLKCIHCGNDFKSYNKTKVVCSDKCYRERMSENRVGEGNPSYRNGVYAKNGNKKIHTKGEKKFREVCKVMNEEMIEKYGYRFCECCGINQSLRWEHHHIVFRSEKPGHEFLHSKENTIHVCIKCHNEYHKNKSKRDSLMKERGLDKIFGITI